MQDLLVQRQRDAGVSQEGVRVFPTPQITRIRYFSLGEGLVDASTCLLNQKLQMLNACIHQKRKWDQADDEFHDAVEDLSTGATIQTLPHVSLIFGCYRDAG